MNRSTSAYVDASEATADGALRRLETQPHGAIAILGARGMGKTHLLRAFHARAVAHQIEVVEVRPHAAQIPLLDTALLCERLGSPEIGGLTDVAMAITRLHEALRLGSTRRHLRLVLLDDLHLFPAADRAVIENVVTQPTSNGTTFIIGVRPGVTREADDFVRRIAADQDTPLIKLGPLQEEQLASLTDEVLREQIAPQFLRDFQALTGGVPGYVIELLKELRRTPTAERGLLLRGVTQLSAFALPARLTEHILSEITGLDARAKRALQLLAFWDSPASLTELRELAEPEHAGLEQVLAELEERAWITAEWPEGEPELHFEVADKVVARVVHESTPLVESMRLHQRAATIIGGRRGGLAPDQLVRLSWHYVSGGVPTSPAQTASILQAARHLNGQNRFAQARDLLRSVLARSSLRREPDLMAEASELLAHALAHLGQMHEAERLLTQYRTGAPDGLDPETRNRILWRLARIYVAMDQDDQAVETWRSILAESGDISSSLRQQVLRDLATTLHSNGEPQAAMEIYRSAAEEAMEDGDLELASFARTRCGIVLTSMGNAEEAMAEERAALELALRARSRRGRTRVVGNTGSALIDLGDLRGGLRMLLRATERSRQFHDFAAVEAYALSAGRAHIELGEWDEAIENFTLAALLNEQLQRTRTRPRVHAGIALIRVLRGEAELLAPMPDSGSETRYSLAALRQLEVGLEHHVAAGRWADALRLSERQEAMLRRSPGHDRWLYHDVLPRKAAVLAELGRADALDAIAEEYDRFSIATRHTQPFIDAQARYVIGLSESVRGNWAEASEHLQWAINKLDELNYTWRAALGRRALAAALRALGMRDAAARELKSAFVALTAMGAAPESERIGAELRTLNRRPPAPRRRVQGVTKREWDVIDLACEGKTDREIATALWLSTRTVSTHMHNILAKLGLRSRFELQAWVDANPTARPELAAAE